MALIIRSPFAKLKDPGSYKTAGVIDIGSINGMRQWAEYSTEVIRLLGFSYNGTRLNLQTVNGQTEAFSRCAPVAAIIGRIAEYSTTGKYIFTDKAGKEQTSVKNRLFELVKKPNIFQTWLEFIASAVTFVKLNGQCYIMPVYADGAEGLADYVTALYVIPNWMVTPEYTGKLFFQDSIGGVVSGYRISGFTKSVPASRMIVVRDTLPNVIYNNTQSLTEGMSRLYSLGDQVNNLIAIQDALFNLTTKRGAMGAWVPENSKDGIGSAMPIDPKEKKEIDEAFAAYGVNSNQKAYMVLRTGMKWVQAAMNVTDLKLFEGNTAGIIDVAMAYNISTSLIGIKDVNYDNQASAGKAAYTSVVIPCVNNITSNLVDFFKYDGMLLGCFDHLDLFQKSKKDEADALAAMTAALNISLTNYTITKTEYRKLLAQFMPTGSPFDPVLVDGNDYYQPITQPLAK